MAEATLDLPQRPPLGIPAGSVRAVLALLVLAVVVVHLIRGQAVPLLWSETLLVVLTHYFTARRSHRLPAELVARLQAEGVLKPRPQPLYLPQHSIRLLFVGVFVGVAVYLAREGRLFDPQTLPLLGTVFAYFLGVAVSGVIGWFTAGKRSRSAQRWEDVKALASLALLGVTATVYFIGQPELLPAVVRDASLGVVLFYLGSRQ